MTQSSIRNESALYCTGYRSLHDFVNKRTLLCQHLREYRDIDRDLRWFRNWCAGFSFRSDILRSFRKFDSSGKRTSCESSACDFQKTGSQNDCTQSYSKHLGMLGVKKNTLNKRSVPGNKIERGIFFGSVRSGDGINDVYT